MGIKGCTSQKEQNIGLSPHVNSFLSIRFRCLILFDFFMKVIRNWMYIVMWCIDEVGFDRDSRKYLSWESSPSKQNEILIELFIMTFYFTSILAFSLFGLLDLWSSPSILNLVPYINQSYIWQLVVLIDIIRKWFLCC